MSEQFGIGGSVRTQQEFEKIVGLGEVKVICVNPNREEYKKILNMDLKEDSKADEYTGESKEGNPTVRLDFWVENTKNKKKDKITFFLEDKIRTNKDETKIQYINEVGNCTWAADPNDLGKWFTKRNYRKANQGEEDLYNFLKSWLNKLDLSKEDAVLQLPWEDLIKGKVKVLKNQVNGEFDTTFVALYMVKRVQKEGEEETKEYQTIYNKAFLPTFSLKRMRLIDYDNDEVVEKLKEKYARVTAAIKNKEKPSEKIEMHERFVLNVKGEYGAKDAYVLKDFKTYDPSEFEFNSDNAILNEEEMDASY